MLLALNDSTSVIEAHDIEIINRLIDENWDSVEDEIIKPFQQRP